MAQDWREIERAMLRVFERAGIRVTFDANGNRHVTMRAGHSSAAVMVNGGVDLVSLDVQTLSEQIAEEMER